MSGTGEFLFGFFVGLISTVILAASLYANYMKKHKDKLQQFEDNMRGMGFTDDFATTLSNLTKGLNSTSDKKEDIVDVDELNKEKNEEKEQLK